MADLLGEDAAVAGKNTLYRCLDKVLAHKEELFSFLRGRWADLFAAKFEVKPDDTADSKTLREFLAKIEERYGKLLFEDDDDLYI
jgi:hypothetical protein